MNNNTSKYLLYKEDSFVADYTGKIFPFQEVFTAVSKKKEC
jgi:hypothetical protein